MNRLLCSSVKCWLSVIFTSITLNILFSFYTQKIEYYLFANWELEINMIVVISHHIALLGDIFFINHFCLFVLFFHFDYFLGHQRGCINECFLCITFYNDMRGFRLFHSIACIIGSLIVYIEPIYETYRSLCSIHWFEVQFNYT